VFLHFFQKLVLCVYQFFPFSTISSELNSLSGVIYKDFISNLCTRQFTEKSAVLLLKLIVVIEGIFCNSLVLLVAHLEELIPLTIRLSGIVQGPLLGLFTLGVLFPKVNSKVGTNRNVDNTFFFYSRAPSLELFVG
jgi:Na+/proline symporter